MATYILSLSKIYLRHYAGLSYEAWFGIIIYLLESSLMGVFYFLSVYFFSELHFSIATAGTIVSFYGLGAMAGGFLGGKLSDRFSPLLITINSLIIQAIAYLLLLILNDVNTLILDMVVLGVSSYSFITSCQLWVLRFCEDEPQKIKALNLLATSSNVGLAVSAVLVSYFGAYGFKAIFVATGVGFLLLASSLVNFKTATIQKPRAVATPTAFHTKQNWMVLGCVFLIGMIVSQLGSTYAIYIQHTYTELGVYAVSILFFLNSLFVVVLGTPLGNYFYQYNKMKVVGISSFLIGLSMVMLAIYPSFILAIIACVIYTLGEILFFCMAQYLCYEAASDHKKGQSLGMFRMVYAASRVAGPISGGMIYQEYGANSLWYACGVIGLGCLIACYRRNK